MMRRLTALLTLLVLSAACSGSNNAGPIRSSRRVASSASSLTGTETVTISASNLAPSGGASVDFVAKAPVIADPSLVSQTVEGVWDSHFAIAAAPTIPEGWAATYFAGQTQLSTLPTTPMGWAAVTRVSATGNYQSDGTLNGNQYVVGTTTATAPPAATSFSGGSAGDGWNVFFSPDRTRVYNVHHHDGPATVMCRKAADGTTCSSGWPFLLYHTSYRSTGWVDPTNLHLWHETYDPAGNGGWECIDTSGATPVNCSTRFVAAFSGASNFNQHVDLQNVGRELYSMDALHSALTCLNLDANGGAGGPCTGQPYAGFGGNDITYSGLRAIGGKIYVIANTVIKCFDPQTKSACTGMSWPQTGQTQPILAVPSSDGVVRNLCSNESCFSLSGTAHTLPAAFISYIAARRSNTQYGIVFASGDFAGTKVFWPYSSSLTACYDMATNAGCPNFPITVSRQYSVVVDPLNANCLWTNGDDGVIRTFNVPTGTAGCTSPPPLSSFKAAVAVPRLACGGGPRIGSWDSFTLTNPPPSGYTSATLTIKDSSGTAVPGWIGVALNGNQALDITSLSTAVTGQAPTFEVSYLALTDLSAPAARFRVLGQSPEVCWTATAQAACPSGGGLLPASLPATSATTVTGQGSIALSGQPSVNFISSTVNITAPNQTDPLVCGSHLGGTLTNASAAPVRDARVELLDAAGTPLLDGASAPIVAISDASGAYTFPTLLVGTYRVRISTVPDYWAISTATVTVGGSGTTSASNGTVTSNVITLTGNATANVNGAFTGPIDSDGDGIPNYVEKGADLDHPIDSDGDGVADYLDLDTDNDGILDTVERGPNAQMPRDTDTDGIPNYLDLDSDGDGIPDAYEASPGRQLDQQARVDGAVDSANGIPSAVETSPGSGMINYVLHDQNGDGTPDYLSTDSDADGVSDASERGSSGIAVDTDGDHVPDYLDVDSDGDNISDAIESNNSGATVDTDGDGTPDRIDTDSDDDGIPDLSEGVSNPDNDLLGNWRDLDSDGDGISDEDEGASDADTDGSPNYLDLDSDGDSIPDALENGNTGIADTDTDGTPDFLDLDSDGDEIDDHLEAGSDGAHPLDSDDDGVPNFRDLDSDDDLIPDEVERGGPILADTDGDTTPDYIDLDSDNDSVADAIEAGSDPQEPRDSDGDGTSDYRDLDSDDDGIGDSVERGPNPTPVDSDADGKPDLIDVDSDGDDILDSLEGVLDPDHDGVGNWRDRDSDGDLIPDWAELDGDFDYDHIPNYLDLDSDGDGYYDVLEAGADPTHPRDVDDDDAPDFLDLDSDNDCQPDAQESSTGLIAAAAPHADPSDNCTDTVNNSCDTEHGICSHGCHGDTDCGDTSSGQICDDRTRLCVPGCRGDSNHCAGTGICSSTDGSAGMCLVDTDGDGIPDSVEAELGLNPNSTDSDGDGIPDALETRDGKLIDTDHDGIPDALDTDSDGDGISDRVEIGPDPAHPIDTDHDGIPDYLDLDADGDGIPDNLEKGVDTDGDGIPDYKDTDSDGDGVSDANELAWGSNSKSADSDGDGISDGIETDAGSAAIDTDDEGKPDLIDTDSDADAISDAEESGSGSTPLDSDEDGIPDFRDRDSDGDGIADELEAINARERLVDSDGDGTPDYLDTDSDGDSLSDTLEGSVDTDGDGIGNWRDLDSDNDCVSDAAEAGEGTELDASKPSALGSDNCPAEAPICEVHTGACIIAERTPPPECNAENAASICISGECNLALGRCVAGCKDDDACEAGQYCDGHAMKCAARIAAGDTLPSDGLHESACSAAMANAVCSTNACNPHTDKCALGDGGDCSAPSDCASNACLAGKCVPESVAPTVSKLSGGSICSAVSAPRTENTWLMLGTFLGIGLLLQRRRRSRERS